MKRPMIGATLGLCFMSQNNANGFISTLSTSTVVATCRSLAVATLEPLPKGKRLVRRKKRPPQVEEPVVDTSESRVQLIASHTEYEALLRESSNTLVVVKFFAPWCRSCKALGVKFRRMSVQHEDVKFIEIDVHQSPELKKALGVRAVPTVKLHAGSLGQVASFTCGPKKAPELERKIELCKDVPRLASRLGRGAGMMEMVASQTKSGKPAPAPRATSPSPQHHVEKGLMEKLAREEMLSESLQQQLDQFEII